MSKAILNKRDKMMWDNSFKPNGVDDTLDLVSEHIEDIVEDHVEAITESVGRENDDYKLIADITFETESEALNIDFDGEYRKIIVQYSYNAISGAPTTQKTLYGKVNTGHSTINLPIVFASLDGPASRTVTCNVTASPHFLNSIFFVGSTFRAQISNNAYGECLSGYVANNDNYITGLNGAFNIKAGSILTVYGVK